MITFRILILVLFYNISDVFAQEASGIEGKKYNLSHERKDTRDTSSSSEEIEFNSIIKLGIGNSLLNINLINGYKIDTRFFLGLGVGLNTYFELGGMNDLLPFNYGVTCRIRDYFMPIFLDFRYNSRGKCRTKFVSFFDIGYSVYLGGKTDENIYPDSYVGYTGFGKYVNGRDTYYNAFRPAAGRFFLSSGLGL